MKIIAGCSAVRLAHLLWEQGVPGSNPGIPTIKEMLDYSSISFSFYQITFADVINRWLYWVVLHNTTFVGLKVSSRWVLKLSACTHWYKYAYLLKRVRRTYDDECAHLFLLSETSKGLRATASKSRRIMSAVGTTLLQSPGCNEGKARYETLGIHEPKVISSSVGAAL